MMNYADLMARTDAPPGSSWGVFGEDNRIGTLNFIGAEQVRSAASLVRRGVAFNLDLPLTEPDPPLSAHREQLTHTMFRLSDQHRDDRVDRLYLQASTQIDGLRHFGHFQHGWYGGVPGSDIHEGTAVLGIGSWAERGIVGRGVLIDIARFQASRGEAVPHAIEVSLLDTVVRHQGTTVERGDIVLIHTGWLRSNVVERSAALDQAGGGLTSPGLVQSRETLSWLWDHGVAMVAADNLAVECFPAVPESPFVTPEEAAGAPPTIHTGLMHRELIPLLGYPLGELWDVGPLASDCADDGVYEFLLTAKPLYLPGGVGSPANALAIK